MATSGSDDQWIVAWRER